MHEISLSLVGRIPGSLEHLPDKENRLADFVLDFPDFRADYTGIQLAALANVSNATASRFIRGLGYESNDDRVGIAAMTEKRTRHISCRRLPLNHPIPTAQAAPAESPERSGHIGRRRNVLRA